MKKISIDIKYLFWIWIALIFAIIATYAHHGHLIIDCGREVYYPTQVMLGKVLYKDIFNIYGPFAYMFNALMFKIFGTNLSTLYSVGSLCSFLIVTLIYLISNEYLSKFLSFAIAIFTVVLGVVNINLFNFIFPYSYGMLYGLVSFLISFWLILKYQSKPQNLNLLYLSSFFAGLCVTSKYEFLPYLVVILYAIIKLNRLKVREYFYAILSLLAIPILCFGVLFIQGLRVQDLVSTAIIIKKMAQTQTLKYFYLSQGVYFNKSTLPIIIINFVKTILPVSLLYYGWILKKRVISQVVIAIAFLIIILFLNPMSFVFLPLCVLILILLNLKLLKNDSKLALLALACVTFSLKIFFGLATLNYGVFFISFILLTFIALLLAKFKENNIDQKILGIYVLLVGVVFAILNSAPFGVTNFPVQTVRGKIFTEKYFSQSTNQLIEYIDKNTKKTDTVVVFPEGLMINFLTQRPSDNIYNSLIPLYIETFGEDKIIEHFKKSKPEYIIFNNWDTKDYYFKHICDDYARDFCSFVATDYSKEKVIDNGFRYLIFKIKK